MDIQKYIHECLKQLSALGIDVLDRENELMSQMMRMPSDILADMEKGQIFGLLLDNIGAFYSIDEFQFSSNQVYSFDLEVFDMSMMYTHFLMGVISITNGDLDIKDIIEDTSKIDFENGRGIHTICFQCNGKTYQYDAISHYDWFDTKVLSFLGQVVKEQNTGKYLFAASDGWQNCILFYNTEAWAKELNDTTDILKLEQL